MIANNVTAVNCLPFPAWDGVTLVSAQDTSYLSTVNVSCAQGYAFEGTPETVLSHTCDAYGNWQPERRTCIGSHTILDRCKFVFFYTDKDTLFRRT